MFKDSSSPVKASSFSRSTPTYLRCIADQTRSKYDRPTLYHWPPRCTPLNVRPVESGIISDHFSSGWKNLSRSPRPLRAGSTNPRCILDQHTHSPIKAHSLPIRPFFQSWRERGLIGSLVWTGLYNALLLKKYYMKIAFWNVHDGRIMHLLRCCGIS